MYTQDKEGLLNAYRDLLSKKYEEFPELAKMLCDYINELRKKAFRNPSDISNWVKNMGKELDLHSVFENEALVEVITFNQTKLKAEFVEVE